MKISVVIPCYEMHGAGALFLQQSFLKLREQSFSDFEIVIGDQSTDNCVKMVCDAWASRLNVKYVDTRPQRGNPSANLNRLMREANGEILKILFQDDLMSARNALAEIVDHFSRLDSATWVVSGFDHTRDGLIAYRPYLPFWQDRVRFGENTLGPPSTVSVRKQAVLDFSEELTWLMDCDFYTRMVAEHGPPQILESVHITSRIWERQNSNMIQDRRKQEEVERFIAPTWDTRLVKHKHPITASLYQGLVDKLFDAALSFRKYESALSLLPGNTVAYQALKNDSRELCGARYRAAVGLLNYTGLTEEKIKDILGGLDGIDRNCLKFFDDYQKTCISSAGLSRRIISHAPSEVDKSTAEQLELLRLKLNVCMILTSFSADLSVMESSLRDFGVLMGAAATLAELAGYDTRPAWHWGRYFSHPASDGPGCEAFAHVIVASDEQERRLLEERIISNTPPGGYIISFLPFSNSLTKHADDVGAIQYNPDARMATSEKPKRVERCPSLVVRQIWP